MAVLMSRIAAEVPILPWIARAAMAGAVGAGCSTGTCGAGGSADTGITMPRITDDG